MKLLRGGIIGFGNEARYLTKEVNSLHKAEIVAAYNRGEANRLIARDQFGLRVTDNVQELLDMDIDFVCVLSANDVHREHVEAAAKTGKPIYCEKPIALSLDDADAMVKAVETASVPNMVNYTLRFVPAYQKMKEIIDSGKLGRILSIWNNRSRAFGLYEAGMKHPCIMDPLMSGGWTVHHACHGIDLLHWMAGDIHEVYGLTQSTVPGGESEEVIWASLRFANGAVGVIGDSSCALRESYTGAIGSRGSVVLQGEGDDAIFRLKMEGTEREERIKASAEKSSGLSLGHFIDCLEHGRKPIVTIRDARHSLAVALAIQQSSKESRPIQVS